MQLPNGPKTLPTFQLLQWISNPPAFLEKIAQKYGDVFTLSLGTRFPSWVFVSHPEGIQQVLDPKLFDAPGEGNKILQTLLGSQSLVILEGDRHKRQRQLLIPPFHGERMRNYGQLIRDITLEVMDKVLESQKETDKPFQIRTVTQNITLKAILKAVFGIDKGERYQKLEKLLSDVLELTGSPLKASILFFPALQKDWGAWSPWGKFVRQKAAIDAIVYAEIAERRQNPDLAGNDILSLLMSAQDDRSQGMTDEELRDELMTLLVAGHETTASALTWAFYWVHRQLEVYQKAIAELDNLPDASDVDEIVKLPYLNAICSETLRIYPVGITTFPRRARTTVEIMGNQIPAGTTTIIPIYLLHHRPDLYPQSNVFRPERFLERQFASCEYLPFGGGNRRCIGMAFALFEMKIVLGTVLSRYQLSLQSDRPVKPTRRGLTLAPSNGVSMKVLGKRQKLSSVLQNV
jgi:cytochrome P450 family 110